MFVGKKTAMAKSKRKKYTHKPKNPPLSRTDKVLYVCAFAGGILALYGICAVGAIILNRLWRADGALAVAAADSSLLAIPFILFLFILGLVLLVDLWEKKQPIFPKKGFRYGKTSGYKEVYPLTDKRYRRKQYTEHEKGMRRLTCCILAGIAVGTFVLAAFGVTGRWAFYKDGVQKYNCINRQTAAYSYADVTEFHMYENSGFTVSYRTVHRYENLGISVTFADGKQVRLQTDVGCALEDLCAVYDLLPRTAQTESDGSPENFLRGYEETDPVAVAIRAMFAAENSYA